jgi:hypothetical protein
MENSVFNSNTKLAAIYYNGGKATHLFRIRIDVTLSGLKGQLDQINRKLNYRDILTVYGVEYRCPSTDSTESVRFIQMKLMNNDDVRTMFSIFGQYSTRGTIELDASLVISVEQIQKSLIRPKKSEEIRALLDEPYGVLLYTKDVHLNAKIIRIQLNFIGCKYNSDYIIQIQLGCKCNSDYIIPIYSA